MTADQPSGITSNGITSTSFTTPPLPTVCSHLRSKIDRFLATPTTDPLTARVQTQTRIALQVMTQALDLYT